jgi:aminopeptidase C
MFNPSDCFIRNKEFPWQTLSDETLIIDAKNHHSFELNELGSFVWNQMDGHKNLKEILQNILETYDVEEETARQDLNFLLNVMQQDGLIEVRG